MGLKKPKQQSTVVMSSKYFAYWKPKTVFVSECRN